jgi:tetratricopeptide (TPR) repeat protein
MGDNSGAVSEWQTALEAGSYFVPAGIALADMALRTGNTELAEEYIVPVLRQEPANLRALVIFCRVLQGKGIYQAARVISNRVAAIDQASASILRGEIALAEHRIAAALLNYEQAMVLDPNSTEAMQGLIRSYREGQITRPMLRQMEQFAASAKNLSSLMEATGRLFAERGWRQDAIRCLRRAGEMDRERDSAAEAMAKLYARHGEMAAATATAIRVRELSALLAGVEAERQHDLAAAVGNYEAAVRGGDSSGVSANNLAWIYARQGRELERALRLARHAYTWRGASTRAPSACWSWRAHWPNHEGRKGQPCWRRSKVIWRRLICAAGKPSRLHGWRRGVRQLAKRGPTDCSTTADCGTPANFEETRRKAPPSGFADRVGHPRTRPAPICGEWWPCAGLASRDTTEACSF